MEHHTNQDLNNPKKDKARKELVRRRIIITLFLAAVIVLGIIGLVNSKKETGTDQNTGEQKSVSGSVKEQASTKASKTDTVTEKSQAKDGSTSDKTTKVKDRWDDYPKKYRKIFRAAESENLIPSFAGYNAKKN